MARPDPNQQYESSEKRLAVGSEFVFVELHDRDYVLEKFEHILAKVRTNGCHNKVDLPDGKFSFFERIEDTFKTSKPICLQCTTVQSMMNAKLIKHRFWRCPENGLISLRQYPTTYM